MYLWNSRYDDATDTHRHVVTPGTGYAALSNVVAYTFKVLRISTAIYDGTLWWPIHVEPNVMLFEQEFGKDPERDVYNGRCLAEAVRTGKLFRGELNGYSDVFQPVVVDGKVIAFVVAGPFLTERPKSTDIVERWRQLTGRAAHPSDPQFADYLDAVQSTLVLEGDQVAIFEQLLASFAKLIASRGRADKIANKADELRLLLQKARFVDDIWDVTRTMIDLRSPRRWHSSARAWSLRHLGLPRMPDRVVVGLTLSKTPTLDAVEEAVLRADFQRSAVGLARKSENALAGPVGDHGVVFLGAWRGSEQRQRHKQRELADRAAVLARSFGFSLHCGASATSAAMPLSRSFQAALGAAQSALTQGSRMLMAESEEGPPAYSLRHLHDELAKVIEERPEAIAPRFDRYLEAVAMHCGYRVEAAQAHLEVGFERMAEALLKSGALDQRSLAALQSALDRGAGEARTIVDLFRAHRRALADLQQAAQRPVSARHDRNLRGALDYIHQHYDGPLSLAKVARIAGFNPTYFSELFRKRENMPFERYVRTLRLERAKQLLSGGDIEVARVARLAGFNSPEYFARVFRLNFGVPPSEYREKSRSKKVARRRNAV